MLCAVIVGPTQEKVRKQIKIALKKGAKVIELRLDLIDNVQSMTFALPTIFTKRGATPKEQLEFAKLGPSYMDLDWTYDTKLFDEITKNYPKIKIICSFHNFENTPIDLEKIYEKMREKPAHLYKMATYAHSTLDSLRMLQLVKQHNNLAGMCMGPIGQVTRILGPIVGSSLTYAAVDSKSTIATGQLTVETLVETYHFHALNPHTQIFGLIGNPLDQSPSHVTHNTLLRKMNQNAVYVKMPLKPDELPAFLLLASEIGFKGLSMTMPLKNCFEKDPVNTLRWNGERYDSLNTDGIGAALAIEKHMSLAGKKGIVLGAGGTAQAIVSAMRKKGVEITILNRTLKKAKDLGDLFGCHAGSLDDFQNIAREGYDLLINATSVGMHDQQIPIPAKCLLPGKVVMDVVHGETPLLLAAKARQCTTISGFEMFTAQANEQFRWWFDEKLACL